MKKKTSIIDFVSCVSTIEKNIQIRYLLSDSKISIGAYFLLNKKVELLTLTDRAIRISKISRHPKNVFSKKTNEKIFKIIKKKIPKKCTKNNF